MSKQLMIKLQGKEIETLNAIVRKARSLFETDTPEAEMLKKIYDITKED